MPESVARCRAFLRRPGACLGATLELGNPVFDTIEREARTSREAQALVASVNRMLARIETSVTAPRDFAGDAAHESRTPLSVMMLSIGRLPDSPEKARLEVDAEKMRRLVNQMLDMSQATALEFGPEARVDLGEVARALVAELTPLALNRNRRIAFEDAAAVPVHGHAEALGRALRNVIENALSHSPAGEVVTVTAGPGPEISVRDRGPGIPADRSAAVLRRFRKLDRSGSDGVGLGLAIVAATMQLHGGAVEIDDGPEGGTPVRLMFPPPETGRARLPDAAE
ncbi:HAMP domain-containing histidine kinase [Amaricoccus solimangrovi]|uniref:histidine kinase n=2 Tax=Amaricoccus solimangrovi TaxID=2589815 RepID=A0A501WIX8_9RHOB|nr:HAMP domain-containing histidine kinase [Amaricoccus solimangrovi]